VPKDFKIVFAPALIFLSFIAFGKVLTVVAHIVRFPAHGVAFYFMHVAQGFCTAAVLAALFCYPVALLYQRSGVIMALAMVVPASYFYLANALSPSVQGAGAVIAFYGLFAYVTLLVFGTWLAHAHLQRANVTLERVKGCWTSAAGGR
jgi:hypothetical protein